MRQHAAGADAPHAATIVLPWWQMTADEGERGRVQVGGGGGGGVSKGVVY